MTEDNIYTLLEHIDHDSPLRGLASEATIPSDPVAMQTLTNAYIMTMYYSALSNLALQGALPKDRATAEERPRLQIVLDRSYADYRTTADWLAKNGGEFVTASPAKKCYDEVMGLAPDAVKNMQVALSALTE